MSQAPARAQPGPSMIHNGLQPNMRTLLLFALMAATLAAQHEDRSEKKSKNPAIGNPESIAAGAKLFFASCGGCHGPTGDGGRGPNLRERNAWHPLDDDAMFNIIRKGVAGADMPPLNRPDAEIWQIVAFVRSLTAPAIEAGLPGDPQAGEKIFWGNGGCGNCHRILGKGGYPGPDLSNIGGIRSASEIRNSILNPTERGVKDYTPVKVTLRRGGVVEGVALDRSNYAMQVLDARGTLHRLDMGSVEAISMRKQSLMPAGYGEKLTREELRDLLSFLARQSARRHEPKSDQ
jgi:putative heme-binding domain-containing protein